MKRGQLTIEFLIILVIMVLLFTGISLDLVGSAVDDSIYIQTSQLLNSAEFMISSTQKNLLLQGSGARKTLIIHAPKLCIIKFGTKIQTDCEGNAAGFSGRDLGIGNSEVKNTNIEIYGGERGVVEFYRT